MYTNAVSGNECFKKRTRTKNILKEAIFNKVMTLIILYVTCVTGLTLMVSGNETNKNKGCDSQHYVAAVVEYFPASGSTPSEKIDKNLPVYEDIISHVSRYDVDILVFPEGGLAGVTLPDDRKEIRTFLTEIPSPESNTIPCFSENCSPVLKKLSCAARINHVYVVINLPEIEYCKKEDDASCPDDLENYYNTNVVFDRQGKIVARYRKYNLFREFGFNSTRSAELCTFDTDFGVRFGMFICFDIMFENPSKRLIQETGVRDVIFSTAWFSELPLLTADSVQSGWAYSNDVNLIAAGYNTPSMSVGGSGIYSGRDGPLVMVMPDRQGTQILLSKVLKRRLPDSNLKSSSECKIDKTFMTFLADYLVIPYGSEKFPTNKNRPSDLRFFLDGSFKYFQVETMESEYDQDEILTASFSYEQDGFACAMTISWRNENNNVSTDYNMFAYSGDRTFGGFLNAHIETCGLTLYKYKEHFSGGVTYYNPAKNLVTITAIDIVARSSDLTTVPIPTTLNMSSYPLTSDFFTFAKHTVSTDDGQKMQEIHMQLSKPVADLVSFGIYKLPRDMSLIDS
ncbi:vanin-like protein 2 isoform X2 [Daktulosphaira vitifoliae]|uniref:vanin-like protein 2 isoform X2 n=2 Tax=Daktulosphaira vitifoliae TaxID=58002 RepID=UPI0021AA6ED4|nr:vanin-like protein 2 isoform X2 [Daktulosphaira vitifoliae]